MAKEKKIPLNLDEEQAERAKYGGLLREDILKTAEEIGIAKEKSAKVQGDLSDDLQKFEDKGGNKKALKWAKQVADMEAATAQDFWRCLVGYATALGVFDQIDMFTQEQENNANAATIAAASAGKPKIGAEAGIH